ncbi:uncharacterized protein LOC101453449 [Ceratitis capitata]|uniref:(Mediterranean fruit fly) hypothetical protein n=1 Tax=Ceratitis capitata TaxID=7213 RepID=W8ANL3_CERCA|nr:uncharacterized protein LOC101453449 [Ceratitis capitata]CAD6998607.1 unnamed protein product [Ceratitis capitata]
MSENSRSLIESNVILADDVVSPELDESSGFRQEVCMANQINRGRASGGHTFVVTTVITENVTSTESQKTCSKKVEVNENTMDNDTSLPKEALANDSMPTTSSNSNSLNQEELSKAIVPISSSLPSKLLRFHAKRSAEALLRRIGQSKSLDSQFGSDEGAVGGREDETNRSPDIFDIPIPLNSAHSPPPPRTTPVGCDEDKLIDVGMGSSIEDSEESEEDDELKPLAVDNHVLHDVVLSPSSAECEMSSFEVGISGSPSVATAVLSEENLEKFHRHHSPHKTHQNDYYRQMDNIYLHPNFKLDSDSVSPDILETSPPPAVAPANSPTEPRRVHRSFLTMKKPSIPETLDLEKNTDTTIEIASTSNEKENRGESMVEHALPNEIDSLDPAMIPSEELAAEIADAVEFYFSNESILKDAFLLKHVRRNKEGFVSLKLVSSFKRVRQLTKEWKVVGDAVRRKSQKIELNDLGTKVRRIDPLPNFDETMPSRTVVACDLPLEKLTIEKVSEIFSKCGEIALIRILKPGMAIPVDVRQFMNKYPEVQQKECALVEYLESSSAREAKNLQGPFQVFEMVAPKKKTGKKAIIQVATPVARMVENYRYYNDATYERTRGGSFSGIIPQDVTDLRHKIKRFNSDIHAKPMPELHHNNHNAPHYHHPPHNAYGSQHRGSFVSEHSHQFQAYHPRLAGNSESASPSIAMPSDNSNAGNYFYAYSPRRYSNNSTISASSAAVVDASVNTTPMNSNNTNKNNINNSNSNLVRRLSNASDNYSSFSDSRRPSNCSENMSQRRDSNCSENCPCSRRISDFGQTEVYRKISQTSTGSGGERRFSNGSMQFERTFSNPNELNNHGGSSFPRRMSSDYNFEQRKQSVDAQNEIPYDDPNVGGGGGGYNVFPRRYSNNFNVANKMAAYDNAQYINGRRISTDSGYDRRYSFGSEYEGSPRSRTGSFLNNYKHGVDFDGQPRSRTGSFLDNSPRSRSGSFAQRNSENLVRTPMGPDGSKGFAGRARKFGQTISPVN